MHGRAWVNAGGWCICRAVDLWRLKVVAAGTAQTCSCRATPATPPSCLAAPEPAALAAPVPHLLSDRRPAFGAQQFDDLAQPLILLLGGGPRRMGGSSREMGRRGQLQSTLTGGFVHRCAGGRDGRGPAAPQPDCGQILSKHTRDLRRMRPVLSAWGQRQRRVPLCHPRRMISQAPASSAWSPTNVPRRSKPHCVIPSRGIGLRIHVGGDWRGSGDQAKINSCWLVSAILGGMKRMFKCAQMICSGADIKMRGRLCERGVSGWSPQTPSRMSVACQAAPHAHTHPRQGGRWYRQCWFIAAIASVLRGGSYGRQRVEEAAHFLTGLARPVAAPQSARPGAHWGVQGRTLTCALQSARGVGRLVRRELQCHCVMAIALLSCGEGGLVAGLESHPTQSPAGLQR
jgi:hypothetical protein